MGYFINYDVNRIIPIANEILNTYYDIFCIININGFNRYYLKYVYEKEVAVKKYYNEEWLTHQIMILVLMLL